MKRKYFSGGDIPGNRREEDDSGLQFRIVGGGGRDEYASSVGGRVSAEKKIGKNTSLEVYGEGFVAKPKDQEIKGKLTGYGIRLKKSFAKGGDVKKETKAEKKVSKVMGEFKEGKLKSSSGQKVTSRKQAVAIALSEAGQSKKMAKGGTATKSKVNEAGNYTKPGMRKALFEKIKAGDKGGAPGQWSARKAQMLAVQYKKAGGGYK